MTQRITDFSGSEMKNVSICFLVCRLFVTKLGQKVNIWLNLVVYSDIKFMQTNNLHPWILWIIIFFFYLR